MSRGHAVGNHEGEILANRRIRDDVLIDDQIWDPVYERINVELERAPLAGQLGLPHRGDPAFVGASTAAGCGQVIGRTEARLDAKGRIEAFGRALGEREPALRDPPTRQRSSGSSSPVGR